MKSGMLENIILQNICNLLGRKSPVFVKAVYMPGIGTRDVRYFPYLTYGEFDFCFMCYDGALTIHCWNAYRDTINDKLIEIDLTNPKSLTRTNLRECIKKCNQIVQSFTFDPCDLKEQKWKEKKRKTKQ